MLLDTPGIHKPRTLLGERTNSRALATLAEVDVVCLLVEASSTIGPGDRYIAGLVQQVDTPKILVVSKTDLADKQAVAEHLVIASRELGEFDAYVPLSGLTGDGVDALVGELEGRMDEGPGVLPGRRGQRSARDLPRRRAGAREAAAGGERGAAPLDHRRRRGDRSRSCRPRAEDRRRRVRADVESEVEDVDAILRFRVRVLVERESQKGMVIGRGGAVIKEAGTLARQELETLLGTRVYLETSVKVERDWQRRAHSLDRLGY